MNKDRRLKYPRKQCSVTSFNAEGLLYLTGRIKLVCSLRTEVLCPYLFDARFHPVAQPGLELTKQHRLDLNLKQSSCLSRSEPPHLACLF